METLEIEEILHDKFINMKDDLFFLKGCDDYESNPVIYYEYMIDKLAVVVQQHLWDEESECLKDIDNISEDQWDKWLSEYEMPEQACSCSRGCRSCLGTEY